MEADLNGSVAGLQNTEAAPSSDSTGPAITQGESSPDSPQNLDGARATAPEGSDETPPPESTEPQIDEAAFQAWLDKQIDADPDAFHKRATGHDSYRKLYQQHADALAEGKTRTRVEQMRLESEHAAQMLENQRQLATLKPEQLQAAMFDDAAAQQISNGYLARQGLTEDANGFRKLVNDTAEFHDNRANAPTRNKIAYEAATAQVDGIREVLSNDPAWKATVDLWDKFAKEALDEHGQTPHAFVAHIKKLVDRQVEAGVAAALPGLKAEMEANLHDEVAARTSGESQPELATAGVGTGGNHRAILNTASPSSAEWARAYRAEYGFDPL